jgi:hypothetical protein
LIDEHIVKDIHILKLNILGCHTEQGFSEDQVNVAEDLTEAPNQGSKVFDIPDPSPAQEGKPRCITQYFKLLHL